jgi:fibronectin-binding autotransporter adhesin
VGSGTITVGSNGSSTASLDLNGNAITNVLALNGYGVGGSSGAIGALTNSSATAATASGAVTLNSTTYIGGSGSGNTTISGAIGGAFGLTKVGTSTLTLSGANTYTGSFTTVNAGTLAVTGTGTLGDITKTLELNNAGVFDLQNKALTVGALVMNGTSSITNSSGTGSLSVTGTSTLANSVTTSGTQTYTGAVTLAAATALNSTNSDVTFGSTVNGAQGLTINQGTGKANFNGIVGATANLASLNVAGTGATYLGSSATEIKTSGAQSYAGNLYLGAATTSLTSTSNGAITVTGDVFSNLWITSSQVFNTTNATTTGTVSWTAPTNMVGNATLLVVGGGGAGGYGGTNVLSYGVNAGGGGGGGVYYNANLALTAGTTYTGTVGVGASGYANSGGYSSFDIYSAGGGSGGAFYDNYQAYRSSPSTTCGSGSCTVVGYAGGGVSYGTGVLSGWLALNPASVVTPQYTGTTYNGGNALAAGSGGGGGAGAGGAGPSSIGTGTAAGADGGAGLAFTFNNANGTTTQYKVAAGGAGGSAWDATVTGGSAGGTAIGGNGGAGSWNAVGGAASASGYGSGGGGATYNNSTGNTKGGAGSGGVVVVGWSTAGNSGANLTINSGTGKVSMAGASNLGTLAITSSNAANTASGAISGTSSALTYTGTAAGALTLSGTNSYTGATTVASGTLKLGNASALGTGTTTVSSGATLDLNGQSIAKAITTTGLGVGSNGVLINSSATAASNSGAITMTGGTNSVGGTGNITLSGVISGVGFDLIKTGSNTLTLSGSNSYNGTTVNGGTLALTSTGSLGSTVLTLDNAGVLDLQNKALTLSSLLMNGTSTITNSSGTGSLSVTGTSKLSNSVTTVGTQTYTGAVTLGAATALNSTNSDISFSSTVNGAYGLTLNQGSGKANFNGIVGGSTPLASLNVAGTGATYLGSGVTGITTSGAQSYAGNLYLSAATTSLTSSGNGAITVTGDVVSNLTSTTSKVFTALDTSWTAPTNIVGNAALLVVGGGGGGGRIYNVGYGFDATGGGGGGGVYYNTAMSVTGGTNYTIKVGAAGISDTTGGYSQFGTITASGGGAGVSVWSSTPTSATSDLNAICGGTCTAVGYWGGGATAYYNYNSANSYQVGNTSSTAEAPQFYSGTAWSGTAYKGGTSAASSAGYGGGGGGAGGSGSNSSNLGAGGYGGAGVAIAIGGTTYNVAAGGGGGYGTGGAVSGTTIGGTTANVTNTNGGDATGYGSGGGGARRTDNTSYNGGAGSTGLVVLAYSTGGGSGANLTINSGSGAVSLGKATNVGNVSITSTAATSAVSGVVSGTGNLTYAGTQTGVLALGAANTYTGTTTVSGGTLKLGAGGTAGAGAITVGSAATSTASLDLGGNAITNAIALNGYGAGGSGGTVGALTNSGANVALAASTAVSLATAASIGGNNGNITLSGVMSGGSIAGLTKVGTKTLTLSGINTYTGATTVSGGTLQIGGAGQLNSGAYAGAISIASGATFKYSSSAAQTLSGAISGAGNLLKDTGTSTLTLTSATNSYTGTTTIDAGTLTVGVAGQLGSGTYAGAIGIASGATFKYSSSVHQVLAGVISGAGAITKDTNATAELWLRGANTYSGAITINSGAILLDNSAALGTSAVTVAASGANLNLYGNSIANNLTLNGTGTSSSGALVNSRSGTTASNSGTVTLAAASSIGGAGNITLSGVVSGAFALTKVGAGTMTLSGANSYSGGSTVSAGTLQAGSSAAFGTGAVSVTSGALLDLNGQSIANNLTLNGTGISSGGALINSSTTAASTVSGTVVLGSASSIGGNNGDITLSGVMSGGSIAGLTKVGTKTLTISGANTYLGGTTVSGGTLKLGSATAMYTYSTSVNSGATLDLNGQSIANNLTILGSGVGGNGALINNSTTAASNSGTLVLSMASTVGGSGDMTLSGVVSGTGINLVKVGAGKTALNALNTYSGTTTISGGILEIGGSGNLTAGSYSQNISIASGASLKYASSAAQTLSGVISGAGKLVKDTGSSSTLTLSNTANTYSGGTDILAGTVKLNTGSGNSASAALGAGAVTVGSSATSTASLDINGTTISNALTLNGYGTGGASGSVGALTTSGYSSTVSGSVTFASDTRVGAVSLLTISGNTSGSGKLTKAGSSSLTMSGATNTGFTGDVAIVGGTLAIGGTGTFAANNAIDIGSGTSLQYSGSSNGSLNGLISGVGGLQLTTAVTLTLGGSAANTYSGGASISATGGTLKAGKTNAFGTGSASLNNGNAYDLNGQTVANAFSITGSGVSNGGALFNSNTSSAATASGNVTVFTHVDTEALIGGAGALNITGKVTASGTTNNIVFVGAGSKTLSNATNDIGTIASGSGVGAITVVDASPLTVGSSTVNSVTYTGISTNNAAVSLTSSHASGLAMNSDISAGTGALSLTGNTLTTNAIASGTGAVTIQPYTSGRAISLGTATGGLNLNSVVLSSFTGTAHSSITIGNSSAGDITVGSGNAFNSTSSLNLVTGGNITLNAASSLTSSKASGVIALQAGGNFINNSGSTALQQTGTGGNWMVYSTAPASDTFGGLVSGQKAIWGQTANTLTPAALKAGYSGNRYVFSTPGTVIVSTGNLTKTYGTDNSAAVTADVVLTGTAASGASTYSNVYLDNAVSDVLATAATVTSDGSATRAAKGTYSINATGAVAKSGFTLSAGTSGTLTVNPKTLNVVGNTGVAKTYDGTTNVTATSYAVTSADIVSGDTVDVTGATVYDNANASAANARTVQVGSLALGGADGGNYTLNWTNGSGTINKANLTVKANNDAKFFGQADPNFVTSAGVAYTGLVNGETSSVLGGTLAIARTGTDAAAGTYTGVLTASGLTASNYNIAYSAGDLTIVQAQQLLVKAGNGTATYGSTGSFAPVVQYMSGGTVYNLTQTANTGSTYSYSDGNGGTATFTLGATGTTSTSGKLVVGNYDVVSSDYNYTGGNFSGTPVYTGNLAVTPLTAALATTTVTKVYDATTAANGAASVSNKLGADVITVAGVGGFDNKNAGTGKNYTLTGLTLSGTDAGNYVLASTSVAGTGDITAKTITASYTGTAKVYDQSTTATVAGSSAGVIAGDAVTFAQTSATFADKNVATAKTVSVSGISLGGTDGGNYALSATTASTTADITAKALTVGYTATSKTYDGATTATVASTSADIIGGDTVGFSQTASFANKNVGTGKTVSVTGIALTGTDANNYSLQNTTATTSATITAKNLTATFTGANKVYDGTAKCHRHRWLRRQGERRQPDVWQQRCIC